MFKLIYDKYKGLIKSDVYLDVNLTHKIMHILNYLDKRNTRLKKFY